MAKISSRSLGLVISLMVASYAFFTPLEAFLDHFLDFHLTEEAKEPPKREYDWLIEAEEAWCKSDQEKNNDRSSSPGDDGGRDFTPNRD